MTADAAPSPPADEFAELVVVGVALLNPRTVDRIQRVVTPDRFYWPVHDRLLRAAAALAIEWQQWSEDERVEHWRDTTAIASAAAGITGRPGDHLVAVRAMDTTPVLSGVEPFAQRVADAHRARVVMVELARAYNALAEGHSLSELPAALATLAS